MGPVTRLWRRDRSCEDKIIGGDISNGVAVLFALEVAEPPIVAALFEAREPEADGVKDDEDGDPDGVNHPKRIAEVGREDFCGASHGRWREEEPRGASVADESEQDFREMGEEEVRGVVEEGDASEDDEGVGFREALPIEPGERGDGGAERHEKEEQGWRVFVGVEEREHGEKRGGLVSPGHGVAVDVDGADEDEGEGESDAEAKKEALAAGGIPEEDVAHAIAAGHYGEPGEDGVSGDEVDAEEGEETLLVEDVPEEGCAAETSGLDGVEEIVGNDENDAQGQEHTRGEMDEAGEHDHRQADGPENEEDHDGIVIRDLKEVDEAEDSDFENGEPDAAGDKEAREFGLGAVAALHPEKSADTGGEHEDGRAEMGDPAGEEEGRRGAGEVGGEELHGIAIDEVADVIDGHDDHDGAAEGVDGLEAGGGRRCLRQRCRANRVLGGGQREGHP